METNSEMSNVIIEEDDNSDAETKTIYERFWEKWWETISNSSAFDKNIRI